MSASPPELFWLPAPPASWRDDLAQVAADAEGWTRLVGLANHRLDGMETLRLDRRLKALFGAEPPPGLTTKPVRLAILASSTVEHLLPAIRAAGLRRGLWITTYCGDYGQYRQELLDPRSGLHAFQPTAVLFAIDAYQLLSGFAPGADSEAQVEGVVADLASLWARAKEAFGCAIFQHAAMPVHPPLLGGDEHRALGSAAGATPLLNLRLRKALDAVGGDIIALDTAVTREGLAAWHDPVIWHRAKQEIHPLAGPVYGDLIGRLLAARAGRAFKALVLDLDNTLWGGVIGDDGLEGVALGQGSALGEAFVAFQNYCKSLSQRGIILALCSKNDEHNGLEPFDKHPDMVLKRSDIAAYAINWTDKATNLRAIAEKLNIGLDALLFADDNPFERQLVRRELPMVAVPELPEDPAFYADCIAAGGYFESVGLTAEDLERAVQYQANAQRDSLRSQVTDLDSYLRSLDMEMVWRPFDGVGKSRIVQLINKTNQFNLTTRRVDDAEVGDLIADDRALTLQIRLLDQFGDNGIIAIVYGRFAEPGSKDLEIETWLMSCRVLGRQVEEATLNLVAAEAQRLGAGRLIGEYRPTAKNGMVREHYPKLGFEPLSAGEDGVTRWSLSLDGFAPKPTFIRMRAE